jgi:hypothetical protein
MKKAVVIFMSACFSLVIFLAGALTIRAILQALGNSMH